MVPFLNRLTTFEHCTTLIAFLAYTIISLFSGTKSALSLPLDVSFVFLSIAFGLQYSERESSSRHLAVPNRSLPQLGRVHTPGMSPPPRPPY
uniref:Uncharacterized protein n=1 Tax=Physcomitrium patens TaxID=3218 RepID=A0A2K1KC51_PHYPA|nr:hypothetical protein PHYPA_010538 [Physcomitrium patens]